MPTSPHVFRVPGDAVLLTAEAARAVATILQRREREISLRGGRTPQEIIAIRVALQNGSAIPNNERKSIENWDNEISDEMTTTQAAEAIGVTDRHVRNLINSGVLTGNKKAGKIWLDRLEVEQYVNGRE